MTPTPVKVAEEVRALERLDLDGLREAWRRRFGRPPQVRSVELLRLSLAWRIQAEVFGGLSAATRRRLREGGGNGRSDNVSAGVRITKQWRGELYEIERLEKGYRWKGSFYPSLSAVAKAITGVKRNGPQFFGLRDEEAA
ncbi:MAG: DUF2924 domain-containing protein [Caulobacter sp.]|nr:DUF2924 domain-containing protein [Caulobacter sp.]